MRIDLACTVRGDRGAVAIAGHIHECLVGLGHEVLTAARDYVRRLEEVSGVPAAIISTGSDRDDTIMRADSVLTRWFGAALG